MLFVPFFRSIRVPVRFPSLFEVIALLVTMQIVLRMTLHPFNRYALARYWVYFLHSCTHDSTNRLCIFFLKQASYVPEVIFVRIRLQTTAFFDIVAMLVAIKIVLRVTFHPFDGNTFTSNRINTIDGRTNDITRRTEFYHLQCIYIII